MLLSNTKKFVFIHIYKVAGSSISQALQEYDCLHHKFIFKLLRKVTGFTVYQNNYLGKLRQINDLFSSHGKLCHLQQFLLEELYQEYFKFAFVRNPWSWQVSLFEYAKKDKYHHQHDFTNQFLSFDEYIKWRVDKEVSLQTDFLLDCQGNFGLNYLGRLETINADWANICTKIGISKKLSKINVSTSKDYRSYYNDTTAQLVEKAFKKDIENFGYEFDGISRESKPLFTLSQELD